MSSTSNPLPAPAPQPVRRHHRSPATIRAAEQQYFGRRWWWRRCWWRWRSRPRFQSRVVLLSTADSLLERRDSVGRHGHRFERTGARARTPSQLQQSTEARRGVLQRGLRERIQLDAVEPAASDAAGRHDRGHFRLARGIVVRFGRGGVCRPLRAQQKLTPGDSDVFVLTYPDGRSWQFHDFEQSTNPQGALKQFTSRGGQSATATYRTSN